MKKKILIALLVVVALTLAWYIVWGRDSGASTNNAQTYSHQPTYQTGRMVVAGTAGDVLVADIYKLTSQRLSENEIIFLKEPTFQVMYAPETQAFAVTALHRDLNAVAEATQIQLLETLDISIEQACTLDISIAMPYSINPDLSGPRYLLPGCSEAPAN